MLARKGRTLITENALGHRPGRRRRRRIERRHDANSRCCRSIPDASAAALRAGLRERLGVTVGGGHHRHHGPGLAQRADRRRDRRRRAAGAARLRRRGRRARQRAGGHRGGRRRRARRRRRPGQGQARRRPGGGGPRPARSTDDGSTGRDLLRPGEEDLFWLGTDEAIEQGRQPGAAAASLGAPVRRRSGGPGTDRGRGRRGADRAGAAPHPAGAVRLAARPAAPHRAAGRDDASLAGRPGRRRQARRRGSNAGWPAARSSTTRPRS